PLPVGGAQYVAYVTYFRNPELRTYAFQMLTAFFSSERQSVGIWHGAQQLLIGPNAPHWNRYVEVIPIPEEADFASPGLVLFPPDSENVTGGGSAFADALMRIDGDLPA